MKKTIKILCLLICMIFNLNYTLPIYAVEKTSFENSKISTKDKKIYSQATLEQDFVDNNVLVILDKNISDINKQHEATLFKSVDISNVKDLTSFELPELQTESNISVSSKAKFNIKENIPLLNTDEFRQIMLLELPVHSKSNVLDTIKKLESVDGIMYAGPNYLTYSTGTIADDAYFENMENLEIINVVRAWDITTGTTKVKVGVIDSGIANHPDLNANVIEGWDFINNDATTTDIVTDHGTNVAGIIGAVGNEGLGIPGIAWNISLVPLNVTRWPDGTGNSSDLIQAVTYATENNIPILNASIGLRGEDFALKQAISTYQGLYVCASGNDSLDIDTVNFYPASFKLPNIISVANTTFQDELRYSSNYGQNTVDLCAPGTNILTVHPTFKCTLERYSEEHNEYIEEHYTNGYHCVTGTSFAAPHVTGVAALIKSIRPELSAKEIKALILDNVDPVDTLSDKCITGGRLNAYKAVRAATESQTFTGDVNGDGKEDVILSRNVEGRRAITVYLGNPNGTFTEPITTLSTWTFYYNDSAYIGDFDGDGLTDVVIQWNNYGYRQLLVYRSRGDGSFYDGINLSSSQEHIFNTLAHSIHIADVNGDSKDDFVVHYESESGYRNALVYKGTSSSPYLIDAATPALESGDTYNNNEPVYTGDFNGDGRADMVVHWTNDSNYRQLRIYLGTANGYFLSGGNLSSLYSYSPVSDRTKNFVADVNGDGYDDFVVQRKNASSGISVLVYKGSGSFPYMTEAIEAVSSTNPYNETDSAFVGDVNGDGRSDMIVHSENEDGYRQLLIYIANSNGAYNTGMSLNTHNPTLLTETILLTDVNGDGRDDLIVKQKGSYDNNKFLTYCGTPTGEFGTAISTPFITIEPYFNSDSATQSRAGTYKIINVGAEKCLNVYRDNVTVLYNQQNVCLWEDSGTNEQRWLVTGIGSEQFIKSVINTNFGLNVYRAGSPWNCDLYPTAGNETDSLVDFIETDGGFKIKLHNYDLYLTAASYTNGANVYWGSASTSTYQLWNLVSA